MTDVAPSAGNVETNRGNPVARVENPPASGLPGGRLEQFETEIAKLGVKGGRAEPDRRLVYVGLALVIAGLAYAAVGLTGVLGAESEMEQGDGLAQVLAGVGVSILGAVLWARYSLSRYLRYWLVRQIFEQRLSTDRVVDAIERSRGS